MRVALVACSKQKRTEPCRAEDLYTGPLFQKARKVAETFDAWYILSARHGLLDPLAVVDPYNLSLSDLDAEQRRFWGNRIGFQLGCRVPFGAEITVFVGNTYRHAINFSGYTVHAPLAGLGIGSQMRALDMQVAP